MSLERRTAVVRDLVEEAKKRLVILAICVVGLSYLMSLTSSSVWVNLPAAASLIIIFRYLSLDFEMRRKAAAYNNRPPTGNFCAQKKPFEASKVVAQKGSWRRKVKSPVVEDAIDQFTRHLISEWVTDLWYSRLTPDKDGPEELVHIMNGVLAEISYRAKNINLIDLITRDVIHLASNHLELFRTCQARMESQKLGTLTMDQRDKELKCVLAANNKLHPALFSAEAEHKVLQHLMDALISLTFNPEDLQCCFFRYIVRELLACAVMRPVLNLATPRFINERIESIVLSVREARKGALAARDTSSKPNGPPNVSSDHFSRMLDPTVKGVELVQMKSMHPSNSAVKLGEKNENKNSPSKDPLLAVDPQSTRSWGSLPLNTPTGHGSTMQRSRSGGEWGDMLDYFSRRKIQALAPENFDNMWTKGKDYKNNGTGVRPQGSGVRRDDKLNSSNVLQNHNERDVLVKGNSSSRGAALSGCKIRPEPKIMFNHANRNMSTNLPLTSDEDDERNLMPSDESESGSSSFYASEDEESSVTGLDTPTTKVWQGTNSRNLGLTHIRHPLESKDKKLARRNSKGECQRLPRPSSNGLRSRLGGQRLPVWKEVERTSFLSGDGQDILNSLKQPVQDEDSSDDYEESFSRVQSGAAASSSASSLPQTYSLSLKPSQTPFLGDAFFKLRCEVVGANIVKSCSKMFAVYSISVIDANNNSWSIKRRFRHFEELHRRLKEYPEYNLHLPPKHFLSAGLDVPVIQERCILLHGYLKKLMQLPTISGSIEVWDFLSVDSQTYMFTSAFSIVETLSVHLDNMHGSSAMVADFMEPRNDPIKSGKEYTESGNKESVSWIHYDINPNKSKLDGKRTRNSPGENPGKKYKKPSEDSGSDSDRVQKSAYTIRALTKAVKGTRVEDFLQKTELFVDAPSNPAFPTEWVPPNLSAPMLDLVDVVLQLNEGGWIRRKAFWVAKQVLQLGMGDALDDWLIEKIRLLRRGSVIASGIKRIEQILWPDGIFITKHPKRRKPSFSESPSGSLPPNQLTLPKEDTQKLEELQQHEAHRRAKFVYELIIEKAPSAIVSLVGRKEYEQCTKDLYFFLQSSVCLKQLALDLLELLLLSAFPEMNHALKQLHEEKQRFGEFRPDR